MAEQSGTNHIVNRLDRIVRSHRAMQGWLTTLFNLSEQISLPAVMREQLAEVLIESNDASRAIMGDD